MFSKLKSFSLVNRLTLLYSLSTAIVLIAIVIFLYPRLINMLHEAYRPHIVATAQHQDNYQHTVIAECRTDMSILLLAGTLGATLLGHFITRRSLRRLDDLTHAMDNITSSSLKQRIDPNDWPKELQQLGITFNHMLDRLDDDFVRISQFTADIAHELRSPIHNLMGETEIALSKEKTPDDYRHLLTINLDEYKHLSRLIENLLFLARMDNQQITLEKERVFIHHEIEKICQFYHAAAEEKSIQLLHQGEAVTHGNHTLLRRAFSNLIANALYYTPPKGIVQITSETMADQKIKITIRDTGVGIAKDHLDKIFDRFYRVDAARAQESGGTGLGLAIVKSIVELHQGAIDITSEPGKGTTISVVLPDIWCQA